MTNPPKSRGSVVVALTAVLALLIGLGGFAGVLGINWAQGRIDEEGVTLGETDGAPAPDPSAPPVGIPCESEGACNYLVLGSDSRADLSAKDQRGFGSDAEIDGFRSDTIILVSIDPATRHATIVSFPRDLIVDIPGHGSDRINAAFSLGAANGGMRGAVDLSARTLADVTGMPIHHVVVVDLAGFKAVVDALGGVPFCTPVSLVDDPQAFGEGPENGGSGLQLDAGCHELDGDTALALVRARYVLAGGSKDCISDYARISRQQQFMRALMNKALSPSQVTNLPSIVTAVTKQLTFDKGIKFTDLADLATAMQGVASGNADFRTIPNQLNKDLSTLSITSQGNEFLDRLRKGEDLGDLGTALQYQPPSPAEIAVRVYDDSSQGHAQNDVYTAQLSESGFKMLATQAEPAGDLAGSGTVILYAKGAGEQADVVKGYVPGVKVREAEPGQLPDDTDVAVVVDASYVHKDPGAGKTTTVETKCPFT